MLRVIQIYKKYFKKPNPGRHPGAPVFKKSFIGIRKNNKFREDFLNKKVLIFFSILSLFTYTLNNDFEFLERTLELTFLG
jgi:hypothetical protein